MKKSIIGLVLLSAAIFQLSSCKKSSSESGPSPETPGTQSDSVSERSQLIKNLSDPLQQFSINASQSTLLRGAKGTLIQIPPYAFVDENHRRVNGSITIKLKEILSKKDMICNNALPVSNGEMLISGGQIYFTAWKGSRQLQVNPSSGLKIMVPGDSNSAMQLFSSKGSDDLSGTDLNWQLEAQPLAFDSMYYVYTPGVIRSNWTNCDYFADVPGNKGSVYCQLSGPFNHTNTQLILSMDGANAITRAFTNLPSANTVNQSFAFHSIPENRNFTLVAIAYIGGNYYYKELPIVSSVNMSISVPVLDPSSVSQINNNLLTLP